MHARGDFVETIGGSSRLLPHRIGGGHGGVAELPREFGEHAGMARIAGEVRARIGANELCRHARFTDSATQREIDLQFAHDAIGRVGAARGPRQRLDGQLVRPDRVARWSVIVREQQRTEAAAST